MSALTDFPKEPFLQDADAFVAFGPGCGSPNDSYSWRSALDLIRETGRPLLLTAYDDEMDVLRDAHWWMEQNFPSTSRSSLFPEYSPNPWRSMGHPPGESAINGYSAVVVPE